MARAGRRTLARAAWGLALGLGAAVLLAPASIRAQVPFAAGTYERWGALFDAPSAPLPAARRALLPEWIRVEVDGAIARVTIEPEARVVWEIRYGAHGAEEKTVRVDGEEVLRVRYERDASGRLVRKVAEGPLAPTPLVFDYQTDARGRVVSREREPVGPSGRERLEARWARDGGVIVRVEVAGVERRVDRWDRAGRLLETRFPFDEIQPRGAGGPRRSRSYSLSYRRDRAGVLVRVVRARDTTERADFARPDPATRGALSNVPDGLIERGEARLLFGAPTTSVDRGRGAARELSDTYSSGCWLNQADRLDFDPTGLFVRAGQGCICGFCVEASQPWSAEGVEGRELHWRSQGWLRVDGELVITGEHELATPTGPRRADALAPGDEVLGADGSVIVIRTIEALPDALRLGHNVETTTGTFQVGRYLVVSEPFEGPRASCP